MNNKVKPEEKNLPAVRQLPKLEELHHDILEAIKEDKFLTLVNQPVPQAWIKQHPTVKMKNDAGQDVPLEYLPIDRVEYLLTKIFQQWYWENKDVKQILNSVVVTGTLHYLHPILGKWMKQDGIGAVGVQMDKGANVSDLSKIKFHGVQIAAPAAESYALKDAAEKIGRLFGKDLSRRNVMNFTPQYESMWAQENLKKEGGGQ